jgi:hypothetical protein
LKPPPRFGIVLNLALALCCVAAAAWCIVRLNSVPVPRLEIRDAVSGRVYGRWPLAAGGESGGTFAGEFAVEFIHSVNNSPVRETFAAQGGEIRPVSVRFFSFGAGMQSDLEAGQLMSRDGDALVITGFSGSVRELRYIVGTVSDHLLYINGETVSLRELCGRNAHIVLQVR